MADAEYGCQVQKKAYQISVGAGLLSRNLAAQVSSALGRLTAVFGMETGVPTPLEAPTLI